MENIYRELKDAPEEDRFFITQVYNTTFPHILTMYTTLQHHFDNECRCFTKLETQLQPQLQPQLHKETQTFYNKRFLRHILEFFGKNYDDILKDALKLSIYDYINAIICKYTPTPTKIFSHKNVEIIISFIDCMLLRHNDILMYEYIPSILISPEFGPYHERIQANIIVRCINLILKLFNSDLRAFTTKCIKQKQSFIERVQSGYCSTCAYSEDKTKYSRNSTYSNLQSDTKLLIFGAPKNQKMHKKSHNILNDKVCALLDDAKLDIKLKFPNGVSSYFISAHYMCKDPILLNVFCMGAISITYNMAYAAVNYSLNDQAMKQSANLRLHASLPISK